MNPQLINIITDFNNILTSLIQNVATICPRSVLGTNIKDIEKQFKNSRNFTKFIDIFCIKILIHKTKIDECNETFFLDENNIKKSLTDQPSDILDQVLSMKSVWHELKQENKDIVFFNLQMLCDLAQQYYFLVTKK
jgi:hypothetical protein